MHVPWNKQICYSESHMLPPFKFQESGYSETLMLQIKKPLSRVNRDSGPTIIPTFGNIMFPNPKKIILLSVE